MTDQDEPVGSVSEEAAKLFGALQDWARDTGGAYAGAATGGLGEQLRDLGSHVGHGEDCRYCPLCQAVRFFRETSPEVKQHLAAAAGSLAEALSAYLGTSAGVPDRSAGPQHIDLDDD